MELGKIIAKNLSDLRNARHLTLGQLSKLSGISKAMLSEIKKGTATLPSTRSGNRARAGCPLYQADRRRGKGSRPHPQTAKPHADRETEAYRLYCYYKSTPFRNFELFYIELDPHSSNMSIGHTDKAQEYVYVIKGELILRTEGADYTLQEGDSLVFDSSSTIPISTGRTRCSPASSSTTIPNKKRRESSHPKTITVRRSASSSSPKQKPFPVRREGTVRQRGPV
ncbi:MAG: XRE family transcriptional regulator [Bilophila sp.]